MSIGHIRNMWVEELSVLSKRIASTSEAWNDVVQKRFYAQFLDQIPREVNSYIAAIDEVIDAMREAERDIDSLY